MLGLLAKKHLLLNVDQKVSSKGDHLQGQMFGKVVGEEETVRLNSSFSRDLVDSPTVLGLLHVLESLEC